MVDALRYKLRIFGITIDGPDDVLFYNELVVTNLSISSSTLNKIHNVICYHHVRVAYSDEIIWVGWIEGIRNLADLFTKKTIYIPTRQGIISLIFNNSGKVVTSDGGQEERMESYMQRFPISSKLQKYHLRSLWGWSQLLIEIITS